MQKINIGKLTGTEFQKTVWVAISKIPKGKVITYKELAKKIGRPKAVRAVGNAVGANPYPVIIPCHRVVKTDGSLGGYSGKGGIKTKLRLLKSEGFDINLMKLMTYNIRDGAEKTLLDVVDVVNSQSPDFLTLNEANTFAKNNKKILLKFAKDTGFEFFDIALSGSGDYHVAIFSKYPIVKIDVLPLFARACIVVLVKTPLGTISVASTHLTPYSEDLRIPEINSILDFQKGHELSIIMGDLNSLSKQDGYDKKITDHFNEIQLKKFTTLNKLRFDVIDRINSFKYIDTAVQTKKNLKNTVPTQSNIDTSHSKLRLDYIFISKALLPFLKSYSVLKNAITEKASDHYPVFVELKNNNRKRGS